MNRPIISIITITLNNKEGLAKTIDSIYSQFFSQYEHIIIDGNSKDESQELIAQYKARPNSQLTYWVSESDNGIYNAMNKGINKAQGEYLLFLNSGDYLEKDVLKKAINQITGEDIIYGNYYFVCQNGNRHLQTFPNPPLTAEYVLSEKFYLAHPATFIKRSLFENTPYNEQYKIASDWEFWIKCIIFKNCSLKHINIPISNFVEGGISSNQKKVQQEQERIMQSLIPIRIIDSLQELSRLKKIPFYKVLIWAESVWRHCKK